MFALPAPKPVATSRPVSAPNTVLLPLPGYPTRPIFMGTRTLAFSEARLDQRIDLVEVLQRPHRPARADRARVYHRIGGELALETQPLPRHRRHVEQVRERDGVRAA